MAAARLQEQVAQISLERRSPDGQTISCSSLFIEPVEWMGPLIIGRKDGKVWFGRHFSHFYNYSCPAQSVAQESVHLIGLVIFY